MRKRSRFGAAIAASTVVVAMWPVAASADSQTNYQATLNSINGSGGSGTFSMTVQNGQATVDMSWSGLAAQFKGGPYPHVQHIHVGNRGECPTMSADQNGDGIVDTPEGQPAYGGIGTTLSTKGDTSPAAATNIKIAPGGSSTDYHRTFQLNQKTMSALKSGTGVVVVHGLNPANLSQQAANAKSSLVPKLPLAATAPALCGALSSMPSGGVGTGDGSTSGIENAGLFGLGGGLLAAAAALFVRRQRASRQTG